MELFKELFASLNRARVKYMVAGGIAVNLYGIERATDDIDIVVELEKVLCETIIREQTNLFNHSRKGTVVLF